jgi:hypothetical protein
MDKESLIWISAIAIFFISVISSIVYVDSLNLDCKKHGMDKGISASDIQVICR